MRLAACLLGFLLPAVASAATLDTVRQRGQLICGVNTGLAGFSLADSRSEWRGLDVDLCRAIAAATLGDAGKTKFVPLTAQQRFTALQSGEIDVLLRNSTQTLLRDTSIGLRAGPITFYDGQGFAVRKSLNVSKLDELNGATVCMAQGTTHEQNALEAFRARNMQFQPVILESQDTMHQSFFAGRCDVLSQDASALAAAIGVVSGKPNEFVILKERISKEPLGPFVRAGDEAWGKIVEYSFLAMVNAEELGLTQANAEEMAKSSKNPEALRLLGAGDDLGKPMGLEKSWSFAIVKQVGNYGESFERNVGKKSPLGLERGMNDLWTRGGLMYSIPFR